MPHDFSTGPVESVHSNRKSLGYLDLNFCELVSVYLKNADSSGAFKSDVKKWEPRQCSCGLCKTFIHLVGFI